jgi:hypothetical protein
MAGEMRAAVVRFVADELETACEDVPLLEGLLHIRGSRLPPFLASAL